MQAPPLVPAEASTNPLRQLLATLTGRIAALRAARPLSLEDCCASLALHLQSRGLEAHPLRVAVGEVSHCVVLTKNGATDAEYILVELLTVKELEEQFGGAGIRYQCDDVRSSIFDPLAHVTQMESSLALLLAHTLL